MRIPGDLNILMCMCVCSAQPVYTGVERDYQRYHLCCQRHRIPGVPGLRPELVLVAGSAGPVYHWRGVAQPDLHHPEAGQEILRTLQIAQRGAVNKGALYYALNLAKIIERVTVIIIH